ncbi:hypothetical protein FGG08_006175 [Glutinoglossum americanum]|uniref:Pinin/SDK/MemA protein domain-containing protein n=1 Tax=Glutinoglossum americanum TaxID=1670608 RepID=A0A9P8I1T1_9PEZI|nr:hypothetical protein FGG08_006175 [Glutinoglossum americanum]
MVEEQITIASAVVLPESEEPTIDRASVKRRQSSISDSGNKRPRLSMEESGDKKEESASPAELPTDRRKSGQLEERKRGQRLFGALLGTLSQSSSSAAQRRRADIEKKQQAKLKLQAEEYDQKRKKELEELTALRKQEQKKFDEQSYYKPWELSSEQEDQIKSQIVEAESTIERELRDLEGLRPQQEDNFVQQTITNNSGGDVPPGSLDPAQPAELVGSESNLAASISPKPTDANENAPNQPTDASQYTMERIKAHGGEDADGVDGGEVVVEAEEDTVIY